MSKMKKRNKKNQNKKGQNLKVSRVENWTLFRKKGPKICSALPPARFFEKRVKKTPNLFDVFENKLNPCAHPLIYPFFVTFWTPQNPKSAVSPWIWIEMKKMNPKMTEMSKMSKSDKK